MALKGTTNEERIWNYLKSKGLNNYGCAGLMGNLFAESGLRPNNLQNSFEKKLGYTDDGYVAAVDSGKYTNFVRDSAGFGLAQWTYWSRKQALLDYAKSVKKSIGDLEMQLEFLYKELTGYKSVFSTLKTAGSVKEASDSVLLNFERPASVGPNATEVQRTKACNDRAGYGQTYYDKYANLTGNSYETGGSKMKYNTNNKPMQCMMTQSTCYKGTRKMTVRGVLWHSTGANNPNLKRYVQPDDNAPDRAALLTKLGTNSNRNDWNHIKHEAGMNCWIGKLADGTVTTVQTMPWDYRPWGCGGGSKGSCNDGWIQFEICEDGLTDKNYFDKVYKEACEITAYLCTLYNIDPNGYATLNGVKVPNILCHADSHSLGLGSNHGDVNHWFPKFGKSMATARADVAALMKGSSGSSGGSASAPVTEQPKPATPATSASVKKGDVVKIASGATYYSGKTIPDWVRAKSWIVKEVNGDRAVIDKSEDGKNAICSPVNTKYLMVVSASGATSSVSFKPYLVKVATASLNIRKGAGTNYGVAGSITDRGTYTIVAEADGAGAAKWGKLKSGAGWISLDYCKKV